jgi:predicted lipoprotein with Yx(FWY)xxD motif
VRRFYIKNTKRQKTYCSRQCGTANTALTATQKRRQLEYSRKLMIAQRAIEQWSKKGSPRTSWKKWVTARTKNEITQQWLTRAVNSGKLAAPGPARHDRS